ncbi:DegQ family serine endoprotease [Aquabacterium sp. A08]|uniref:DegQ family serine endoprotease n=1 Tax=Aquabacterium sp. A08 TaxID=2718532 RepID=UPI00142341ED|nr:DegQ family serine endoprotease [Aquabacterium sp. A08]NIC43200.1 DegQ family serine endoprotease [Aquabacterium sp. A08]
MPVTVVTPATRRYAVAAVAAASLVAVLWSANHGPVEAQTAAPTATASATTVAPAPLVTGLPDFTVLVDQVGPSVVNIRTVERVRQREGASGPQDPMQEFFRRFGIPLPPGMAPRGPQRPDRGPETERPRGVGSGFVLSPDGFIMTNAHVVDGADEVVVTLPDQREFKAKVVGADQRTDVAVVKIDAQGLKAVRIGDVGRLKVGEWVIAIGSPFGLENTVTAGIVSAKQRDTGDYLPFIQTDVAINPGNSGGPLINLRGEVVGINSQIYSRSGGFQGISFAIPIDEAVRVSDQLRSTGKVTRGRIGVAIDNVTKELADTLGLDKAQGALVRGVEAGSPAAQAGVEPGDIILSFAGKPVEKSADLPRLVGNTAPGTRAPLQVWRRGAAKSLTLTVGTFEDETVAQAEAPQPAQAAPAANALGLAVRDLTAAEKRELQLGGGVRVVQARDAAASAGLREDDVIVGVGNQQIASLQQFESLVAALRKDRPVSVLIRRGEWAQYALIRPSGR